MLQFYVFFFDFQVWVSCCENAVLMIWWRLGQKSFNQREEKTMFWSRPYRWQLKPCPEWWSLALQPSHTAVTPAIVRSKCQHFIVVTLPCSTLPCDSSAVHKCSVLLLQRILWLGLGPKSLGQGWAKIVFWLTRFCHHKHNQRCLESLL